MTPEQRIYPAEGQDVSDTAIRTTGFQDLYLALGDDRGNGRWTCAPMSARWRRSSGWAAGDGAGRDAQSVGPLRVRATLPRRRGAAGRMKRLLFCPAALLAAPAMAAPVAPAHFPIRRWRRAPATCSGNCAAWSARAKALTNSRLPWRRTAPCGAPADGGRPQRSANQGLPHRPLWELHPDAAAVGGGHLFSLAAPFLVLIGAGGGGHFVIARGPQGRRHPPVKYFRFLIVWRETRNDCESKPSPCGWDRRRQTPATRSKTMQTENLTTDSPLADPAAIAAFWR